MADSLEDEELSVWVCELCNIKFGVDKDFVGIVFCPYCQKYVGERIDD